MEKYSILMSVYLKSKDSELETCFEGIFAQTYLPDQIVIVYDGPISDDVKRKTDEYDQAHPGIFTVVQLKVNGGLGKALAEGLHYCRNNLVARMDSDDISFPDRCRREVLEFEKNPELALIGCNTEHFKQVPGDIQGDYSSKPIGINSILKTLRRNCPFSHPTVMFRKTVVEACGNYDPELRRSQDHDLFSKMLYQGFLCENLPDVLVYYRTDENGVLRNRSKESRRARIIIQKRLFRRKQCSLGDYLVVASETMAAALVPEKLYFRLYYLLKGKKDRYKEFV